MARDFYKMLEEIVKCQNMYMTTIKKDMKQQPDFDMGIRNILLAAQGKEAFFDIMNKLNRQNVVYFVSDYFDAEYCVLCIPEADREEYGDYVIVGPYQDKIVTEEKLNMLVDAKGIPHEYINELRTYYSILPVIADMEQWRRFCNAVCRVMNGSDKAATEYIVQTLPGSDFVLETADNTFSTKVIEERYEVENRMLKAVANGKMEEALEYLSALGHHNLTPRYKNMIRDVRNGMIVLNTLLRKAAEIGGVHPVYLDEISGKMAKKIELLDSVKKGKQMQSEMVRKYCMLVRNNSVRDHSPVIQKTINYINMNLEEDISLKRLAEEGSINASYLSTLFRKEMGMTVTDYANQQRIRRAVNILNSYNMQIQDVATECGICDVNYFRKLFKKQIGMTPSEYVKTIKKNDW